jgi:hypothetical protein
MVLDTAGLEHAAFCDDFCYRSTRSARLNLAVFGNTQEF